MGLMAETNMLNQMKKGQAETTQRLDAVLEELKRTNHLLAQLTRILAAPDAASRAAAAGPLYPAGVDPRHGAMRDPRQPQQWPQR
jgi:hypothetical protein